VPNFRACAVDDLEHRQALGLWSYRVFPEAPNDVLHVDDGVVDQLADGDGEPAEAHAVDRETESIHPNDGGHQRQRQREQRNDCRPDVHQEHDDDEDDEYCTLDKRDEEVVERLFDEIGLPKQIAMDLHALRQGSLDIFKSGVDALGQFQCVDRRLFLNAHDDGRFGVVRALAPLDRRAFANDTHVLYEHWGCVRGLDADGGDGVGVIEAADTAHEVLLPLRNLKSCSRVPVGGDQRLLDFLKRHLVGRKAYRIEDDFVLLLFASRGDDLRDARHGQQPTSDDGFSNGP
jgi:hypothetical protein